MGMGTAAVAVADDAAAWFENPAGLGAATGIPVKEGRGWGADLVAGYSNLGGTPAYGATFSGWQPKSRMGIGVGGVDISSGAVQVIGGGFGVGLGSIPVSAGVNVVSIDAGILQQTIWNAGLMYCAPMVNRAPLRFGLTATDVTNELGIGTMWNAGIAWPATPDLLFAFDIVDAGQELGSARFNGGAEYSFGSGKMFAVRAGFVELLPGLKEKLTVGLGCRRGPWRFDAAYINLVPAIWAAGLGVSF